MGIVCKCGNSKTYIEGGRIYCCDCGRDKGTHAMTGANPPDPIPAAAEELHQQYHVFIRSGRNRNLCARCGRVKWHDVHHMKDTKKESLDPTPEMNNQINNNFYESIEEGVREIIFLLRNAGINTECSCHHDGYIQCQTLDPTTDVMRIKAVMAECNISNFTIKIKYEGFHFGTMDIYSPSFVMKENEND